LPPSSKAIGYKWVFRRKYYSDGSVQNFKALVACITFIRALLILLSIYHLYVNQMNVKTTFLNVKLDEES
jgi:hypothetical protein